MAKHEWLQRADQHFTVRLGEHCNGDSNQCNACGTKTILVSAPAYEWDIDSEEECYEELGYEVQVDAKVTGHYCPECRVLTSLSFNQRVPNA